jgi:centrosomal protein CEP76
MIEGDDNTYDNLGIAYFHLSEIKGCDIQGRKYFADDLKKNRNYTARIYVGQSKLESAYSLSNNTRVHFEAWFLEDFPSQIDFGEKKSKRGDKIPLELMPFLEKGDKFEIEFSRKIKQTFQKYTNYPYAERLFNTYLKPTDQYKNSHLLPYYLSNITAPRKEYSRDDKEKNANFFDCNLSTLDEIAHYVRCFPYIQDEKQDIWATPDFMLKIRKGGVSEHAIMMASMMMGINKREQNVTTKDELNKLNNKRDTETNGSGITTGTTIASSKEKIMYPYENKIFVCMGKLKITRAPHIWVMSVSEDYSDVTFWDTKLSVKYDLIGRIDDPEKLRTFLNGKYPDYQSVVSGKVINKIEEEEEESIIEQEKPKYDDRKPLDKCDYNNDSDIFANGNVLGDQEILLDEYHNAGKNEEIIRKKSKKLN